MVSAKRRILIFSSSYVPVIGGVQTVTHSLAKQLISNGHEVRVVTNRYPRSLPAYETIDGVRIERLLLLRPQADQLRRNRPDLFFASLYFGPQSDWRLKRVIKQFRPDAVNVHFPDRQVRPILSLHKQFAFRLVVSLHGHDVERFANGNRPRQVLPRHALQNIRSILQSADAVTVVSHHLLRKAIQVEPSIASKIHVIQNGIDPARFHGKESYTHPRPYILAVGRLTRKKGFDLLLDGYEKTQSQNKPDLIIAGAGEEGESLKKRAAVLGLNGTVHFYGQANPNEVVKLINGCGSVVVPSRSESFGVVALEALAAGKPLIATETGGLKEFLNEIVCDTANNCSTGTSSENVKPRVLLVEPTVDGIACGIRELLETNGDGRTNPFRLPEKYHWAHVTKSYERLLVG